MYLFMLKTTPPATARIAALELFQHIQGPTAAQAGCLASEIYEGPGDERSLLYMEQWNTSEDLDRHIQSELFAGVLTAMDLSTTPPVIRFHETSRTQGIELIESLRKQSKQWSAGGRPGRQAMRYRRYSGPVAE